MGTYPMYTTDPRYRPPALYPSAEQTSLNAVQLVNSIEYEHVSDIQMKDNIRKTDGVLPSLEALRIPQVDRSSKLAALQLYTALESHAKVLDQSITQGQQTMHEWMAAAEQSERVPQSDELQSQRIQSRMTELEYKLMELDDQRDRHVSEPLLVVCDDGQTYMLLLFDGLPRPTGRGHTTNIQLHRQQHDGQWSTAHRHRR